MLAERLRFPWLSVLVIVPLALAPTAPTTEPMQSSICLDLPIVEVPTARLAPPTTSLPPEQLYKAGDFEGAANAARPIDANLAELYDQLALQWTIGMSPTTRPTTALPALREAAKLDTVFGGEFAPRIQTRIATVLPDAAVWYFAHRDYDAARQAVETADIMGLRTSEIDLVRHKLEREGR